MSVWHVTNHKLYRGANPYDTSEQIFLVGTEFGFGKTMVLIIMNLIGQAKPKKQIELMLVIQFIYGTILLTLQIIYCLA